MALANKQGEGGWGEGYILETLGTKGTKQYIYIA